GDRNTPSDQRAISQSLCIRDGVAGRSPPHVERRSIWFHRGRGTWASPQPRLPRLLAAEREMKNEHVLSGLIAKRAELAGKIEIMQREMRELVATIGHIDATIRAFDPNTDLEDIKPKLPPR